MLQEIKGYAARRESFAFETTLSGLGYLRHIKEWRASDYHVMLFFLTLPSIDMAIAGCGASQPRRARYSRGCHTPAFRDWRA
jgi:predicted ABC-type ATPase